MSSESQNADAARALTRSAGSDAKGIDDSGLPTRTRVQVRVRYVECDPMGVAYHGSFVPWLEMARTELLRERGVAYRDLEASGVFFVVARMEVRYRSPARYDDVLEVACATERVGAARIDHRYRVTRMIPPQAAGPDGSASLIAEAATTLACVDREGRVRALPVELARG